MLKKKCMDKKNLFFMINENQYIHINCNTLLMEDINLFQKDQHMKILKSLMSFIKVIDQSMCVSSSMVVEFTLKELFNLFKLVGKFSPFLKCNLCNRVVKKGYEENHLKFCKERECNFRHIDNIKCNSKSHKNKFHLNFLAYKCINSNTINQNLITKLNTNLLSNKNNFMVLNSNLLNETISIIQNEFNSQYRIVAKKCLCLLRFKSCNCFLQILNNCDPYMYFKRQKKNLYYAMKDLKLKGVKLISIILVDYSLNELKNIIKFQFLQNIRKNHNFKVIFLSKDVSNFEFIKTTILNKQNIAYHNVDFN